MALTRGEVGWQGLGEEAGEEAGGEAREEAGEEAGGEAGEEAGEEAGGEAGEELGEELEALGEQVMLMAIPGTLIKIHIRNMTVTGVLYRSYGNQSLVCIC